MREIKDFNTEKNIFIGKVLNHIHYKKLHTRIYDELSNHMDDMYEDFSSTCDDEKEIIKKVLDEMGNPDDLGQQLKEANKKTLSIIRTLRIICAIASIPIIMACISLGTFIIDEIMVYFHSEDIMAIEEKLQQEHFDGKEVKLIADLEHNDTIYKVYVPAEQSKNYVQAVGVHSITAFGIPVKNKFILRGGGSTSNTDGSIIVSVNDDYPLNDYIIVYFGDNEETYIQYFYEPRYTEEDLEPYWSDFIEVPQDATSESPKWILIDSPDGYRAAKYERYDENKEVMSWN